MTVTSVGSAGGAPISFNGLASGLNTSEIISALLGVERAPITQLANQRTTLEGQQTRLRSIQGELSQLTFAAQELGSPLLFKSGQTAEPSEPGRVAASVTTGAAVGGYEVEVTQLANSGQRTFTFKSPAAAQTLTIDGHEVQLAAGANVQDLVNKINADSSATVYAASPNGETVVFSTRETGASGPGFIAVAGAGETLTEQAALAKEGRRGRGDLGLEHPDECDPGRNADAQSTNDDHGAGDRRGAAPRAERELDCRTGAVVREAVQRDGRPDPDAAHDKAAGDTANELGTTDGHAVRRSRPGDADDADAPRGL
jgi:hypothetical protein